MESITLRRGEGGVFEVEVDGRPVFSKKQSNRHAATGEVVEKIGWMLAGDGRVAGRYEGGGEYVSS